MHLNPDEWKLVLADPATNYHIHDHTVGLIAHERPDQFQPVLLFDAIHIETNFRVRFTARVPIMMVPELALQFGAMEQDLRQQGAIS